MLSSHITGSDFVASSTKKSVDVPVVGLGFEFCQRSGASFFGLDFQSDRKTLEILGQVRYVVLKQGQ
jgi:hypothetical protein